MARTVIDELAEKAGLETTHDDNPFDVNPVDAIISPDSLFDPKVKAMYDAEPKKRVYIPTPEGWKQPYPYAERIEINGIRYIIVAEQDVMVPTSVAAVWENKKAMEREVNRQIGLIQQTMNYSHISQVPHWYR